MSYQLEEEMLEHLKSHLKGRVVILGIGNTLRSDDGAGSLLANRLQGNTPFTVWDTGTCPENYLNRIIKDKPDTIVIIDAADFGGLPGEFRVLGTDEIKTANLFSTHNASPSLLINYLQSNLKVDIIILIIQPKNIHFSNELSPEVSHTLNVLEGFLCQG